MKYLAAALTLVGSSYTADASTLVMTFQVSTYVPEICETFSTIQCSEITNSGSPFAFIVAGEGEFRNPPFETNPRFDYSFSSPDEGFYAYLEPTGYYLTDLYFRDFEGPTSFEFGKSGATTIQFQYRVPGKPAQLLYGELRSATLDGQHLGVPEPSTWALMALGFGAIGAGNRRRKRSGPDHMLARCQQLVVRCGQLW